MSRKILKKLRKKLPNMTQEQTDAFDEFYKGTAEDPFKTFESEKDFKQYLDSKVAENIKPIKEELNTFKNKDNFAEAKEIFGKAYKPSMFKYMKEHALNEDGTFNEEAKKASFWKEKVDAVEDKENYIVETPAPKVLTSISSKVDEKPSETGKIIHA